MKLANGSNHVIRVLYIESRSYIKVALDPSVN